jgi:hypothetical protein
MHRARGPVLVPVVGLADARRDAGEHVEHDVARTGSVTFEPGGGGGSTTVDSSSSVALLQPGSARSLSPSPSSSTPFAHCGGGTSDWIVQVYAAGVGSATPLRLTAATRNLCWPTARPVYVFGVVQAAKTAPSSEQRNVCRRPDE